MGADSVALLVESMLRNERCAIQTLLLDDNVVLGSVASISRLIARGGSLRRLSLASCLLIDPDANATLVDALRVNRTLTELCLRSNHELDYEFCDALTNTLETNWSLVRLELPLAEPLPKQIAYAQRKRAAALGALSPNGASRKCQFNLRRTKTSYCCARSCSCQVYAATITFAPPPYELPPYVSMGRVFSTHTHTHTLTTCVLNHRRCDRRSTDAQQDT
jgi:hypothetical protein